MPEHFGHYRLDERLDRGGMGEVWRAFDTRVERAVALKLLRAGDADSRARFLHEAGLAARLPYHPNIININAYGERDGGLYIEMPLLPGADLEKVLAEQGPMLPGVAVEIVEGIAAALAAVHAEGLVHGDVKPSNVVLTAVGGTHRVCLVDFGISRPAATGDAPPSALLGTVRYVAPELSTTHGGDARSDVYSLACLLAELLTGEAAFPDGNRDGSRRWSPNGAARPAVCPELDEVVAQGLAARPDRRYGSADAFARAARRALTPPERRTRVLDEPTVPAPEAPTLPRRPEPRSYRTPSASAPRRPLPAGVVVGAAVAGVLALLAGVATLGYWLWPSGDSCTLPGGEPPRAVAAGPDGRTVYAAVANTVTVLDPTTCAVTATVPVGDAPGALALAPGGDRLYVANRAGNSVSVIDTRSNLVAETVPVPPGPVDLAVSPDGTRVYVGGTRSGFTGPVVAVIDTVALRVTGQVGVGGALVLGLSDLALDPDGRRLLVTLDYAVEDAVQVLDAATLRPAGEITAAAGGVAVRDGRTAYVADGVGTTVAVLDTANRIVVTNIDVGEKPLAVVLSPDGSRAFVPSAADGSVSVVDTTTNVVTDTHALGGVLALSRDGQRLYVGSPDSAAVSVVDLGP